MANNKPTFAKLGLKRKKEVKTFSYNDNQIEVLQYLPIEEKLDLITKVVNKSFSNNENSFYNPVHVDVFFCLELVYHYTNISFTEKQKENEVLLFDLLQENGLLLEIISKIPEDEYNDLFEWVDETIESVYSYQTSALGIMDSIGRDYSNLKLDAEAIQEKVADPENLTFLKEVVTKLG